MEKDKKTTQLHNETIPKLTRIKLFVFTFLFSTIGVLLDQYTKTLAVRHLKGQNPFVIWKNVFELCYLENRGAAFGILQNKQIFFLLSVMVIGLFIIIYFYKVPLEKKYIPLNLCAAAILSGAIGNCIDRISQGYVVDFFYFKLIDFPIFNVADIYVTIATFCLVVLLLWYYKEEDLERIFHS